MNDAWRTLAALLLIILLAVPGVQARETSPNKVCLAAPYAAEMAYAYASPQTGRWILTAWWRIDPGACTYLKPSVGDQYYLYASVRETDYIGKKWRLTRSSAANGREAGWFGEADDPDDPLVCVPYNRSVERAAPICTDEDMRKYFFKQDFSSGNRTSMLRMSPDELDNLGVQSVSLEEMKPLVNMLTKQMKYSDYLNTQPLGAPYRLGIETVESEYGVFVKDTIPGMPAHGFFKPGDRIVSFNGVSISSAADLTYAVQSLGYRNLPNERYGQVVFHRGTNALGFPVTPCSEQVTLCLAYFPFLDPRSGQNAGKALVRGIAGGVLWGFDGEVYCIFKAGFEAYEEIPANQRDRTCVQRLRRERAELNETNQDIMQIADFGGSLTSPRVVWRFLAKQGAKRSIRTIAVGALDEAVQGVLAYKGKLDPGEAFSLRQAAEEALVGASLGAGMVAITGH